MGRWIEKVSAFYLTLRQREERGATAVEAALVSMICWTCLAATLDFARYFAVLVLMTQGAQSGLLIAQTEEGIERVCSVSDNACNAAVTAARTAVIDEAKRVPTQTIVIEQVGAAQELVSTNFYRPGDAGHESYSSLTAGDNLPNLFQHYPLIVELQADVRLMLPTLGTQRIVVTARGFRDQARDAFSTFPEVEFFPNT